MSVYLIGSLSDRSNRVLKFFQLLECYVTAHSLAAEVMGTCQCAKFCFKTFEISLSTHCIFV